MATTREKAKRGSRTARPSSGAKKARKKAAKKTKGKKTGPKPRVFDLEVVRAVVAVGGSRRALAAALECGETTIARRMRSDPAFAEAMAAGEGRFELTLRRRLFEYATDRRASVRSSAVRALLVLLGPYGVSERHVVEHEGSSTGPIVFYIPSNGRVPCDAVAEGEIADSDTITLPPGAVLELPPKDGEG